MSAGESELSPGSSNAPNSSAQMRNNGTFRWTDERNNLFLREVMVIGPYMYKVGSNEAGKKWSEVAEKINCYSHFKAMPRDQRSVRDHFNKLIADFKRKMSKEEAGSGISPKPPTVNEKMLEEIVEIMSSSPKVDTSSNKEDKKRKNALLCKERAMSTWSKNKAKGDDDDDDDSPEEENSKAPVKRRKRRGGSEALQYLAAKTENETEMRRQELEIRKEELRLQAEQQKEQFKFQQEQMKLMADILSKLTK